MKREVPPLVLEWHKKSDSDLLSAERLLSFEDPTIDTALFHLQQAFEKAIKGLLIFHSVDVAHTHDVEFLLEEAIKVDAAMTKWEGLADLSIYAVVTRYPESHALLEEVDPDEILAEVRDACAWIWRHIGATAAGGASCD